MAVAGYSAAADSPASRLRSMSAMARFVRRSSFSSFLLTSRLRSQSTLRGARLRRSWRKSEDE